MFQRVCVCGAIRKKALRLQGEELSSSLAMVPAPEHLPQAVVSPSATQAGGTGQMKHPCALPLLVQGRKELLAQICHCSAAYHNSWPTAQMAKNRLEEHLTLCVKELCTHKAS